MSKEQKSLIVENLSLKYDDNVVLNDINFEIGENEMESGKLTVKDMLTGEQSSLNISELIKKLS